MRKQRKEKYTFMSLFTQHARHAKQKEKDKMSSPEQLSLNQSLWSIWWIWLILSASSLKSHSKTEFGHRGSLGDLGRTLFMVDSLQSIIDERFWVETSYMGHRDLSTLTSHWYMPSASPRNTRQLWTSGKGCNPHSRQVIRKFWIDRYVSPCINWIPQGSTTSLVTWNQRAN